MIRLFRFLHLSTTRDVIINTGGNYLNIAFAGFYTLFLVRVFDPVDFGVLSVLLASSYLLANIFSFGMPASIYAHLPQLLHNRNDAIKFVKTNFLFLALLSGISLFVVFLFIDLIDEHILRLHVSKSYYIVALISTELYIWQNYIRDVLNAAEKFLHINIALNISNVIKIFILLGLAFQNNLTVFNTIFTLGIIGPIIVMSIVLLERKWIVKSMVSTIIDHKTIKFGYTFTYFVSTQLFNLATRIDLFMVSYFLSSAEVGYYGLSQRIVIAVVTSADSITQVLSPQFAKIKRKSEVISLMKKAFVYMLLPTGIFIAGILMPSYFYDLFFTAKYAISTPITRLLGFAYLPFAFTAAAVLFFLYTIKKPIYLLISNAILLVILAFGNYVLIPKYGLYGPPIVFITAFTVIAIFITASFFKEYKKLQD